MSAEDLYRRLGELERKTDKLMELREIAIATNNDDEERRISRELELLDDEINDIMCELEGN